MRNEAETSSHRRTTARPRSGSRRAWLSAFCCLLLLLESLCAAQSVSSTTTALPRLMIVSQPRGLEGRSDFVDMGFFLARAAKELNRYDVVLYSPKADAISNAVKANRLEPGTASAYLGEEAMRKVAEAIGAVYIVRVSATRTRQGIGAVADMLMRTGSRWTNVFSTTLAPYKGRNRKSELLDAIHAHVAAILPGIASAPPVPPAAMEQPPPGQTDTAGKPGGTDQGGTNPPRTDAKSDTKLAGPTTADLLIERFRKSGDTANLIVSLRKAVTERPRDVRLRRELINALRIRGWTQAARDEAARALAVCGDNAELYRLLGEAYAEAGEHAEAIKAINQAIRLEPGVAQHRLALGDTYLAQGMTAEAEAAYTAARDADPSNAVVRFRIARLRAQSLRFADAAVEIEEARKANGGGTDGVYAETYGAILEVLDGAAQDAIGRLTALRRDFLAGTVSREDAHRIATSCRDGAAAMTSFLSKVQVPVGYGTAQPLYLQATALLAQSSATFATYLESRDDADEREATLLRQEAARQLEEAARSLAKTG